MARFRNGWIKLDRQTILEDVGQNSHCLAVWVWLQVLATVGSSSIRRGGKRRVISTGTIVTSECQLSELTGMARSTVRRQLEYLQETKRIQVEKSSEGTIIRLCSWEEEDEEKLNELSSASVEKSGQPEIRVTQGTEKEIEHKLTKRGQPEKKLNEILSVSEGKNEKNGQPEIPVTQRADKEIENEVAKCGQPTDNERTATDTATGHVLKNKELRIENINTKNTSCMQLPLQCGGEIVQFPSPKAKKFSEETRLKMRAFIARYADLYREKYRAPPESIRDKAIIGKIGHWIESVSEERAMQLLQVYMQIRYRPFDESCHDLWPFFRHLNRIGNALATGVDPQTANWDKIFRGAV